MSEMWLVLTLLILLTHDLISSLECRKKNTFPSTGDTHECYRTCEYPAKPRLCEYEFTVTWTYSMSGYCLDCPVNPDECNLNKCVPVDGTCRPVIVINGNTPGPSIQVCHGDTIRVKVNNDLHDHSGLSVHWHGQNQVGTNWMDGVSMITQCPIASASSFVYKFIADPPGTHWWHSHAGVHRGDGMYGSLIVREPIAMEINKNEYDFDLPEHVMQLTDWTSNLSFENFALLIDSTEPTRGHTLSILMNGKGRQVEFIDSNGDIVYTPRAEFEVQEGMRYRVRMINSAFSQCSIRVAFDAHPVNIIGSDGYEFGTIENIDAFSLSPGERLDVVLTANALPSTYCIYITGYPSLECDGNGGALLRYKNTTKLNPDCEFYESVRRMFATVKSVFSDTSMDAVDAFYLNDTFSLHPVDPQLHNVDEKYYISLTSHPTMILTEDGERSNVTDLSYQMDHVEFKFPETPFLTPEPVNIDTCQPNQNSTLYEVCNETLCKCTHILKLKLGQVVEFVIVNNAIIESHTMHMHGQSFRVLAQESLYNPSLKNVFQLDQEGKLPRIPLELTVVKDTVNVPRFGYTIIRWKADNPGYWFFHCHDDYHSESGMTMVIQVGQDEEIPNPPNDFPICAPWSPD